MNRHYATMVGDVLATGFVGGFPFSTWATSNRFEYPVEAKGFLSNAGSAAEAFFARPFVMRTGVQYVDRRAFTESRMLELQVRCGAYSIDAVVSSGAFSLAVEIDGLGFHHKNKEQVAKDYVRERRIVLRGYTLIRFTAGEVFGNAIESWRQIEAILERRGRA